MNARAVVDVGAIGLGLGKAEAEVDGEAKEERLRARVTMAASAYCRPKDHSRCAADGPHTSPSALPP